MNIDDSRFQYAVNIVLEHEGGLSNDKDDKGGLTRYGVSLRYLLAQKIDPNKDGIIDEQDIRKLTIQQASDIYRKNWWEQYGYNNIKDLRLATKVFDLSVNCGPTQSHKFLQRAIGVKDDGILGPKTLMATNNMDAGEVISKIRLEAKQFYMNLVEDHKEFKPFLKGWLNRSMW